jgi:hypothetical protein
LLGTFQSLKLMSPAMCAPGVAPLALPRTMVTEGRGLGAARLRAESGRPVCCGKVDESLVQNLARSKPAIIRGKFGPAFLSDKAPHRFQCGAGSFAPCGSQALNGTSTVSGRWRWFPSPRQRSSPLLREESHKATSGTVRTPWPPSARE